MCAMMEAHVAERPYRWPIAWSGKRATNTGNQSTGSSSKYSLECLHILRLEPRRVAELECRKVIAREMGDELFQAGWISVPMWWELVEERPKLFTQSTGRGDEPGNAVLFIL